MVSWLDKKVYIETHSRKIFQGVVIDENETKLVLIDKFHHQVELSKIDIKSCQEQEYIKYG